MDARCHTQESTIRWPPMLPLYQPTRPITIHLELMKSPRSRYVWLINFYRLKIVWQYSTWLVQVCFEPNNQMVKCDPRKGVNIMTICLYWVNTATKHKLHKPQNSKYLILREVHGCLPSLQGWCCAKGSTQNIKQQNSIKLNQSSNSLDKLLPISWNQMWKSGCERSHCLNQGQ